MSDTSVIWINGELKPAGEVHISPYDLGLTVGLGVFETMAVYDGKVFAYDLHHARLEHSAQTLGLVVPDQSMVENAMAQLVRENGCLKGRFRVRVSVSGGVNPMQGGDQPGNVIITVAPAPEPAKLAILVPVPYYINDCTATSGVKSSSYADHLLAYRYALRAGGDEALMLNTRGQLCEGAMSNVFLVRDGVVKTPPLSSGCLAGVTRGIVLSLCKEEGLQVEECDLGERDAFDADELFLTSSLREVQAAVMLDSGESEQACPGEVTRHLAERYHQYLGKELA